MKEQHHLLKLENLDDNNLEELYLKELLNFGFYVIIGGTSASQGVVVSYRGNPVQNIQQLMEYANPDNAIDEMLENFRKMFMSIIIRFNNWIIKRSSNIA